MLLRLVVVVWQEAAIKGDACTVLVLTQVGGWVVGRSTTNRRSMPC